MGPLFTAVGLVLLVVTMPDPHGTHSTFSSPAMIAFEAVLFGMGGLFMFGPRAGARAGHHGVMLAAAAGILFGVCNVAVKAMSGMVGDDGVLGLASPWLIVAALASASAFYASARSLQHGEAVEVIAITGTAANIAGIIVFGDPMLGTALGVAIQGIAFVLVVIASALTPAPVRSGERAVPLPRSRPRRPRSTPWPRGPGRTGATRTPPSGPDLRRPAAALRRPAGA